MEEILKSLYEIAATSLRVGWPLLIMASGLSGVACFGGKGKVKTAAGWALFTLGFILLIWNLRRG